MKTHSNTQILTQQYTYLLRKISFTLTLRNRRMYSVPKIDKTITENVFVCLTRRRWVDEGSIVKYFVSEEYNVNDQSNSSDNYFAGRFVFKPNDNNLLQVFALAEEPAKVLLTSGSEIENLYLQRKNQHPLGKFFLTYHEGNRLR